MIHQNKQTVKVSDTPSQVFNVTCSHYTTHIYALLKFIPYISLVMVVNASVLRSLSSTKVAGSGGTYSMSFTHPQRKKSQTITMLSHLNHFSRISFMLRCQTWFFSSPDAYIMAINFATQVKFNVASSVNIRRYSKLSFSSLAACMKLQNSYRLTRSSSYSFCSNCMQYGFICNRVCKIFHTVGCRISSSRLARYVDF